MATTSIEWTDRVWNPVTGCTKVSPGCKHCYAETIADRFWATQYPKVEFCAEQASRPRRFTDVWTHEDRLLEPLSWRKPSKVFVNSMSDLFHEDVPDEFIDRVFAVMAIAHWHTFQVLTKRAARMRAYMTALGRRDRVVAAGIRMLRDYGKAGTVDRLQALPNVWLGVSVEDQPRADERIPLLLQTPAAVRFISAEPLLGLVDIYQYLGGGRNPIGPAYGGKGLDWVIVGGESGPKSRPFDVAWARLIVQQCQAAGVACFVKQMGANWREHSPNGDPGLIQWTTRDRKGGDPNEWSEDLRVREFPCVK